MKKISFQFYLFILIFFSCQQIEREPLKVKADKSNFPTPPNPNPNWIDSGKVEINIDTTINCENISLMVDSILFISYKGSDGEIIYDPINSEGKWLDSIFYIKKLTKDKVQKFQKIITDNKLSNYDTQLCCYDPKFGLIFFKNGIVIGHSSFSLKDLKIQSTFFLRSCLKTFLCYTIMCTSG